MCSHATAPLSLKGSPHMICLNGEDMAIYRSPSKKHTPDGPPFTNTMVPLQSDPTFATKVWAITSPRSQRLHIHGRRRSTAVPVHKLEEIDKLVLVGKVQVVRSRPSRTHKECVSKTPLTKHVHASEYELQNEVRPIGYMPHRVGIHYTVSLT